MIVVLASFAVLFVPRCEAFGVCYENPNSDGSCPFDDITYHLYTRDQPNGIQITTDNFNSLPVAEGQPWKIIFHGYSSDKDALGKYLKNAYLQRDSYNLLLADYPRPYMKNFCYMCYPLAATVSLDLVASCTTQFLVKLLEAQVLPPLDNLHFIGHSLGAHTAASVCIRLAEQGYGRVARLTGLDAAGVMFSRYTAPIRLLQKGAAVFVDAYHSNGGKDPFFFFGFKDKIADVDVLFNGGSLQPGCGFGDIRCNHYRAVDYFAESILPKSPNFHKFNGYYFENNQEATLVGEDISLGVQGTLYVFTNAQSPFARDK